MTHASHPRILASVLLLLLACVSFSGARAAIAQDTASITSNPAPKPWPRTFEKYGNTLVMYAPQVDSWTNHSKIQFRMAIAITEVLSSEKHYGAALVHADTIIDKDTRTVLMTNLDVALNFPGVSASKSDELKLVANDCLPTLNVLDISLDEVNAYIPPSPKLAPVAVNLNPPPMYYSDVPAILVIFMGQPQLKPITGSKLLFAVNTNWPVLMDMNTSQYYLLSGDSWLTSADPLKGPWTAATSLPADFSKLPDGANWDDVRKHIPGTPIRTVPRVITSTEPAELIATNGTPEYSPVEGTRLLYVSNPTMPLFLDMIDGNYYYMVSGRWFRAATLTGPWTAASADLPPEFAKIPASSPVGFVLASVPNTQEARDAITLATTPHKSTVIISDTKLTVTYDGTPKFVPITGTQMTYAVNTGYQVIAAAGQYYCCFQGVWFVGPAPTGPWLVTSSVPAVIYTIPPTSPVYNVTYVQVYSSTPTTVVVGYTAGYSGEYVAATGALMFGAGMLTGALLASNNDNWYGCNPCYYSYGCAAHYSYASGCYYRSGGSCYGPCGGAGWGSSYNASTGTWARGAAAYGPAGGSAYGAQAYNPWTNTYAAHTGSSNGYSSAGHSYVQQGNSWAEAGHQSTARGSTGWAENSAGQWAEGAHSNVTNTSVAKTSSGDVYASHDGNVYKQSDGSWQKYQGGGNWQDTSWNKPTAQTHPQTSSSAAAESSWSSSMQTRTQAQSSGWGSSAASSGDQWKSNWGSKSASSDYGSSSWGQHDTQQSLSRDSYSRNRGSENASSSWQSRSSGSWGGSSGGWGGRSGGGWGGGWGGRSGGFRGRR